MLAAKLLTLAPSLWSVAAPPRPVAVWPLHLATVGAVLVLAPAAGT